jgi:hypothetical protein
MRNFFGIQLLHIKLQSHLLASHSYLLPFISQSYLLPLPFTKRALHTVPPRIQQPQHLGAMCWSIPSKTALNTATLCMVVATSASKLFGSVEPRPAAVPSVFGRNLQYELLRKEDARDECYWSHTCSLQAEQKRGNQCQSLILE